MNEQLVNSPNEAAEDLKKVYEGFVKPVKRSNATFGFLILLVMIAGIISCFYIGWLLGIISTIAVVVVMLYITNKVEASYKRRVKNRISQLEEIHGLSHQESFDLFHSIKLGSSVGELKTFVTEVWGDTVQVSAQEQIAQPTSDEKTHLAKPASIFDESGEASPDKITEIVLASARKCSHDKMYLQENIPEKKAQNARASCNIPPEESLIVLIDCTSFGSAKDCLVCTEVAVYVHNDWGGKTRGTVKIPYPEMRLRVFSDAGSYEINLGNDQFLNTAGAGSKKEIIDFLFRIRTNMVGDVIADSVNCPRCGSDIFDKKSELITSKKGHFVGQALFGIVGNIVAGAALGHTIENCECKSCGWKWVNEKPVPKT